MTPSSSNAPGGDFRDWQTIDAFAEEIAGRLSDPDDAEAV
jgi:hypothetical protein